MGNELLPVAFWPVRWINARIKSMHIVLRKNAHSYVQLWALFHFPHRLYLCIKEEATCLQWPIEQFHSHFYDLLMLFQADKHNLTSAHTSLPLSDLRCRKRNWHFAMFFFLSLFLQSVSIWHCFSSSPFQCLECENWENWARCLYGKKINPSLLGRATGLIFVDLMPF